MCIRDSYYGNVGDEPVIAYLYIDGYIPDCYNQTGKLSSNASENVFNFVYSRAASSMAAAGNGANDKMCIRDRVNCKQG